MICLKGCRKTFSHIMFVVHLVMSVEYLTCMFIYENSMEKFFEKYKFTKHFVRAQLNSQTSYDVTLKFLIFLWKIGKHLKSCSILINFSLRRTWGTWKVYCPTTDRMTNLRFILYNVSCFLREVYLAFDWAFDGLIFFSTN